MFNRDELIHQARKIYEDAERKKGKLTTEEEAQYDSLMGKVEKLAKNIQEREEAEKEMMDDYEK
jgi:hypothetical protein